MSQELFYTSAPKGLQPGSRGFCTVATTRGMSAALIEKLESLSGYRPLFPPLDSKAGLNPVVHAHVRIKVGGKTFSLLSRICAAGLDYSERTNKFAHHMVLDGGELPPAGPAWLLGQPGFMETQWDGEVKLLPEGRTPPRLETGPGICRAWQKWTGDAGWAGVLAETFQHDPTRLAYLLFEPGLDPLPLIAETLALLPPEQRWEVTFSTYFTGLPQGTPCIWRCVPQDSVEAQSARQFPNALILHLGADLGQARGGALVEVARGRTPAAVTQPPWAGKLTGDGDLEEVVPFEKIGRGARTPLGFRSERRQARTPLAAVSTNPHPAQEEVGSLVPPPPPPRLADRQRRTKTSSWLMGAVVGGMAGVIATLGVMAAIVLATGIKFAEPKREGPEQARSEEGIDKFPQALPGGPDPNHRKTKIEMKTAARDLGAYLALARALAGSMVSSLEKKKMERTLARAEDETRTLRREVASMKPKPEAPKPPLPAGALKMVENNFRLPNVGSSSKVFHNLKLNGPCALSLILPQKGVTGNFELIQETTDGLEISLKRNREKKQPLARFQVNGNKLDFKWVDDDKQNQDKVFARQLVRNSVLRIREANAGATLHVGLMSDKSVEKDPLNIKLASSPASSEKLDWGTVEYQPLPNRELFLASAGCEIKAQPIAVATGGKQLQCKWPKHSLSLEVQNKDDETKLVARWNGTQMEAPMLMVSEYTLYAKVGELNVKALQVTAKKKSGPR